MRVICPLSACSSYVKRDQFLSLLSDIAQVTHDNEPKTIAYAWFASTGDNTEAPNHWVRGFEVYEDETALSEVHRGSEPYKRMRSSIIPAEILSKPTDLRFLQPAGPGFLTRARASKIFDDSQDESGEETESMIVVWEIKPKDQKKPELISALTRLADFANENRAIETFWILEYLPEYQDDGIVVFSRYVNRKAYICHSKSSKQAKLRAAMEDVALSVRTTRWKDTGIGFIGR